MVTKNKPKYNMLDRLHKGPPNSTSLGQRAQPYVFEGRAVELGPN